MTFEIYEYKPNADEKLEKVVYETIEVLDPSEASTPFEYLERYITNKRVALERVNNEAIYNWHATMYNYMILRNKVENELKRRGLDPWNVRAMWDLKNPMVERMADLLCEVYLMTYGNTEAFMLTDIIKWAPMEMQQKYKDRTCDTYYTWLQYMDDPYAARPVRPVIPESEYSTYDKDEAKKIIVAIRDKFIRNNEDSLADALKLCSFLGGAIRRIYNILPQESIDKLSAVDKNILDYGFGWQANLQTRCDSELAEEGISVIKKLLTREDSINEIILLVYSHLKA